ncbi:hypothetical protein [Pseudomonas sp. dw_358]|nr:hypothetical protein [Pseudomonas sp. dw_358]
MRSKTRCSAVAWQRRTLDFFFAAPQYPGLPKPLRRSLEEQRGYPW